MVTAYKGIETMQQPASSTFIKPERVDPAFLPPSYHLQQQQQQNHLQQQHKSMPPNVHSQVPPVVSVNTGKDAKPNESPAVDSIEMQPDFPSIKGVFGWTTMDNVNIPHILRGDKKFVSVRIVEQKLLSRYPNSYPDDLGKHAPLTSFFITSNEAKLYNEINVQHCECEYGKKEFNTKELIVLLSDFVRFYELVKKTFPDAAAARAAQIARDSVGWLQIKNTVTPYVKRADGNKYVPLNVIQYAAGLLTNGKVKGSLPTEVECQMLNEACKVAGVEFVFSDATTRLICVNDVAYNTSVDIIELPSNNPLKHATYMELPTSTGKQVESSKPSNVPIQEVVHKINPSSQSYTFQPNPQLDAIRAQIQGSLTNRNGPVSQMPQMAMPPRPVYSSNMFFDQNTDRRFARISNGPPNMSVNPNTAASRTGTQMHDMLQHTRGPSGGVPINHNNMNAVDPLSSRRSPGCSSNTSPRSRPPSLSRPPSGSPLSPGLPSPHQFPQFNTSAIEQAYRVQQMVTNDQQIQNMYAQRYLNTSSISNQESTTASASSMSYQRVHPNANQEIPGLFSPTGTNISPHNTDDVRKTAVGNSLPPLLQMANNPRNPLGSPPGTTQRTTNGHVTRYACQPILPKQVEQPKPQSLTAVNTHQSLVGSSIKGAWLNSKSISCLFIEQGNRMGQYCLVEAVCKLYFNGCSVTEFLFALEKVLNVPLITCTDAEEKAFINYYSLPVTELKCNKMIKFSDLEKYFPQLTYMFPSKEAIAQSETDFSSKDNDTFDYSTNLNGITLSGKRSLERETCPPSKQQRHEGYDNKDTEDAVIILD
ncbi:uncharacterized protein LOC127877549 isoform X2 [Dreissena polymorpha]|uniref:Uncharacterized protein n=1 Tax=Dreissena polymorpha TaxID=45954 RepID=A0A9D4KCA4_DREPO|nr:uncharacterized protein LOC127877549 isoform X2 [Dreissena polymorpha]KAH3837006.1 hypothetical protein DPMN_110384 [Dreissena polymorpha]